MRKLLIFYLFSFALILITTNSCREPFLPDFREVEIINQPPKVSLDTLTLAAGFGTYELDLNIFVSDPEGDDFTVTATSEHPDVVTVEVSGNIMTIFEVGLGYATIKMILEDGTDRNPPAEDQFVVEVAEYVEPETQYKWFMDLSGIPNGTSFDEYTLDDGTEIGRAEGSPEASRVIQDEAMEWSTEEYDVMSIIFASPLDLSQDATFVFEYADFWGGLFWVTIVDDSGGEGGFGDGEPFDQMVLDDPSWNTFETDLNDWVGGDVDLSAITEIYFELYDAQQLETFKFRNMGLGIFTPFIMEFSAIPDGTPFEEYTLDDGTEIGTAEASAGTSRTVQNGVLEWTTDEWDLMSIIFPEPYDFTPNTTFSIEYADLWSDQFGLIIVDAYGGEAGFGWDEEPFLGAMDLDDPSYNTFEFDLSDYTGVDVDLSAVTEIYFEKWGAEQEETFILKELAIGK
jgi:hypothetical protein